MEQIEGAILLLLLLLHLQRVPAAENSLANCKFPSLYADHSGLLVTRPSQYKRDWYTTIMGQYSPRTDQLVVVFTTPHWINEIGEFNLMLAACTQRGGTTVKVSRSDSRVVHSPVGTNVTLFAIDLATSQRSSKLPTEFGLCLQLYTSADGDRIVPRAMSPTAGACHVSMTTASEGTNFLPPQRNASYLDEYLWQKYHLVVTDACCLDYKHGGVVSTVVSPTTGGPRVLPELIALYYIGGVCVLSAAIGSLYYLRGLGCCCRQKVSIEAGNLALRISCDPNRPLGYRHLLSECKSAGSGLALASLPFDPESDGIARLSLPDF